MPDKRLGRPRKLTWEKSRTQKRGRPLRAEALTRQFEYLTAASPHLPKEKLYRLIVLLREGKKKPLPIDPVEREDEIRRRAESVKREILGVVVKRRKRISPNKITCSRRATTGNLVPDENETGTAKSKALPVRSGLRGTSRR